MTALVKSSHYLPFEARMAVAYSCATIGFRHARERIGEKYQGELADSLDTLLDHSASLALNKAVFFTRRARTILLKGYFERLRLREAA